MRQTDLHYYYMRSSGGAAQRDDIFPSDGTDDGDGEAEIGHANVFRYSATNQSDHRGGDGGGRKSPRPRESQ